MPTLTLRPISEGYNEFTKTGGSTSYGCINEETADGDTTYLTKSTSLIILVYGYANFQLCSDRVLENVHITDVRAYVTAKDTSDLTTVTVRAGIGIGSVPTSASTSATFANSHDLSTSYVKYSDSFSSLLSSYNYVPSLYISLTAALYRLSLLRPTPTIRITQVYVEIDYEKVKPTIAVTSQDKSRISDETGFTQCTAAFTSDQALSYWEARATIPGAPTGHGAGLLVESGTLERGATGYVNVTNSELTNGDYTYTIYIYGQNSDGLWSDG